MKVTELRKGALFVENQDPWKVLEYNHIKVGRGGANIKVKARNLKTDKIREFTYHSGAKVIDADVEVVKTVFLYRTGKEAHFANKRVLPLELVGSKVDYLKNGVEVGIVCFADEPIDLLIPITVDLKVTRTDSAVAGNTAGNATKEAHLESGLKLQVPLFVSEGDVVRVNTESGSYVTRV
ncbi:MAG: elongation factor P [bacterium]